MRGFVLAISVALVCMSIPVFGQTTDANLVGTVSDSSGASIANAALELTNQATSVKFSSKTNANGEYRFNNLPVGLYTLGATAPGFSTATIKGLDLQLGKTTTSNITLQVGSVSSTVDVSEAAATIDTTTAQVQTSFEAQLIVNLPIIENSNGFYGALNLSLLSAGVASNGGTGYGVGPSVGGQRPTNNNFMIEGVDNNRKDVTGPVVYVPTDATQEFTLMENQTGAEMGHSSGGHFNTVIKGGSNEFHGSLYEYFQNKNLNAVDQQFARQGIRNNPRFDQNKLGLTVGGPLKKDKLFFFGSVEYSPLGASGTPGAPIESPTAAGLVLLNKIPGLSATNLGIFEKYVPAAPSASDSTVVNGVTIPTGILPTVAPNYTNFYSFIGSVDYNPSDKDQIRARYISNKQSTIDFNANLPVFWATQPTTYYLMTVSDIHTFSPNLTNEFRIGYNRFHQSIPAPTPPYPGLDTFPNITFDNDLGLQLGPDSSAPQSTVFNTYELVNNINWTKSKHTFKFGIDARDLIAPQTFIQRVRGDYDYSTLSGFLNDQVPDDLAERNLGGSPYYGNQWATYLYASDAWRARQNFTIDLGVRWERTTVPIAENLQTLNALASVPGLIQFTKPKTANHNFAPRLGLAYSPGHNGNTSIRAGFGISYDVLYDNLGLLSTPPEVSTTVDAGNYPNLFKAPFLANGGIFPGSIATGSNITAAQARAASSSFIPNQELPYALSWNLGVQHVFHKDYTLEVRYLGTRGVHLPVQDRINVTNTPVTPTLNLPTYLSAPSQAQLNALPVTLTQLQAIRPIAPAFLNAGFTSNLLGFLPMGNSVYNGLAVQATRRFSHGLQFIGAYTWSHAIDDSTDSVFATILSPRRAQDFSNQSAEKATSALDRRQRFTMSWLYQSTWLNASHSWLAKNIAGNWRIVGTYTAETGELATAESGIDSNLNGDSAGDRTIINTAGTANLGSGITALKNSAGATVAYLANNPNARYIEAGSGAYANGGRNTLQMPGINNFDLSFAKTFSWGEKRRVEFRADAANGFNHPQYTAGLIDNIKLTSQTSSRVFLEPQSQQFLQWNQNFPSNARTGQLALKVVF